VYMKRYLSFAFLALIPALGVGPCVVHACARVMMIKDVGTQFQVTATDRGEPAVGVEYVLRRGDDQCRGGEVLAKATTDRGGKAEFGPVSAGPATLCTVDLQGHEWSEWSVNVRAIFSSHTNIETQAAGWNPIPVRAAAGVIRVANYSPSPEGQGELMVTLADIATHKSLYQTTANMKGEFSFSGTIPGGRYYLTFVNKVVGGELYVEVRPDSRYASLNVDAEINDCGTSAMQREPEEPAKVTIACGQVFDSTKQAGSGQPVMLFDEGMSLVERVVTDKDGKFQFSPQNAGHYLVYAPRIPDLPARREIEVQLAGGNASTACIAPLRLNLDFGYSDY
jgi:hypothetical protein